MCNLLRYFFSGLQHIWLETKRVAGSGEAVVRGHFAVDRLAIAARGWLQTDLHAEGAELDVQAESGRVLAHVAEAKRAAKRKLAKDKARAKRKPKKAIYLTTANGDVKTGYETDVYVQ